MNYWQTWQEIILTPTEFFKKTKLKTQSATIFLLKTLTLSLTILAVMVLILASFFMQFLTQLGPELATLLSGVSLAILIALIIIGIPIALIVMYLAILVSVAILHLFTILLGSDQPFKETYIAICYASAPTIINFLPILGYIGAVYNWVLQVLAIKQRHNFTTLRALLAVLLPVIAALFVMILMLIITG